MMLMRIKVELANGQEVVIDSEATIESMVYRFPEWIKFVPLVKGAHTIFMRAEHIVGMWQVDEEALYRLENL